MFSAESTIDHGLCQYSECMGTDTINERVRTGFRVWANEQCKTKALDFLLDEQRPGVRR